MATEYLDKGAKTFASTAWSGSGIADSNDFIIEHGFAVSAGLDHSGLTTGIESMYFKPGSNGVVGGGSAGSLLIDADASADAYIANYGDVSLYLAAAGGSSLINNFSCGGRSVNFLTAGTFGTITVDGGQLSLNESVAVTGKTYINRGSVNIEYNAQDGTLIQVNGGTLTLKRMPTTLTINAGTVIFDPDEGEDFTSKVLNMNGGKMIWKAGAIPTAHLDGGIVDFRQNNRAFTPGATEGNSSSACTIHRHPDVTLSNIVARGSSKVDVGAPTLL